MTLRSAMQSSSACWWDESMYTYIVGLNGDSLAGCYILVVSRPDAHAAQTLCRPI